jgi:hypothetical protein
MSKSGPGPGRKSLLPEPRPKFCFDWGQDGIGIEVFLIKVGMGPKAKFILTEP